jgi:hypothetical protein
MSFDEQEVVMVSRISAIKGIGKQAVEVFERAGFLYIIQLANFKGDDHKLLTAIQSIKDDSVQCFPESYWRRLMTRCINIIYRVKSTQATDFVPDEYMCPISLDWFEDPVVVASGHSYSKHSIEEHLQVSKFDPLTRIDISDKPIYSNFALKSAVEHYRLNYQRFRILD